MSKYMNVTDVGVNLQAALNLPKGKTYDKDGKEVPSAEGLRGVLEATYKEALKKGYYAPTDIEKLDSYENGLKYHTDTTELFRRNKDGSKPSEGEGHDKLDKKTLLSLLRSKEIEIDNMKRTPGFMGERHATTDEAFRTQTNPGEVDYVAPQTKVSTSQVSNETTLGTIAPAFKGTSGTFQVAPDAPKPTPSPASPTVPTDAYNNPLVQAIKQTKPFAPVDHPVGNRDTVKNQPASVDTVPIYGASSLPQANPVGTNVLDDNIGAIRKKRDESIQGLRMIEDSYAKLPPEQKSLAQENYVRQKTKLESDLNWTKQFNGKLAEDEFKSKASFTPYGLDGKGNAILPRQDANKNFLDSTFAASLDKVIAHEQANGTLDKTLTRQDILDGVLGGMSFWHDIKSDQYAKLAEKYPALFDTFRSKRDELDVLHNEYLTHQAKGTKEVETPIVQGNNTQAGGLPSVAKGIPVSSAELTWATNGRMGDDLVAGAINATTDFIAKGVAGTAGLLNASYDTQQSIKKGMEGGFSKFGRAVSGAYDATLGNATDLVSGTMFRDDYDSSKRGDWGTVLGELFSNSETANRDSPTAEQVVGAMGKSDDAQTAKELAKFDNVYRFLLQNGSDMVASVAFGELAFSGKAATGIMKGTEKASSVLAGYGNRVKSAMTKADEVASEIATSQGSLAKWVTGTAEGRKAMELAKMVTPKAATVEQIAHSALTLAVQSVASHADNLTKEDIVEGVRTGTLFGVMSVGLGKAFGTVAQRLAPVVADKTGSELAVLARNSAKTANILSQMVAMPVTNKVSEAIQTGRWSDVFDPSAYNNRHTVADMMYGFMGIKDAFKASGKAAEYSKHVEEVAKGEAFFNDVIDMTKPIETVPETPQKVTVPETAKIDPTKPIADQFFGIEGAEKVPFTHEEVASKVNPDYLGEPERKVWEWLKPLVSGEYGARESVLGKVVNRKGVETGADGSYSSETGKLRLDPAKHTSVEGFTGTAVHELSHSVMNHQIETNADFKKGLENLLAKTVNHPEFAKVWSELHAENPEFAEKMKEYALGNNVFEFSASVFTPMAKVGELLTQLRDTPRSKTFFEKLKALYDKMFRKATGDKTGTKSYFDEFYDMLSKQEQVPLKDIPTWGKNQLAELERFKGRTAEEVATEPLTGMPDFEIFNDLPDEVQRDPVSLLDQIIASKTQGTTETKAEPDTPDIESFSYTSSMLHAATEFMKAKEKTLLDDIIENGRMVNDKGEPVDQNKRLLRDILDEHDRAAGKVLDKVFSNEANPRAEQQKYIDLAKEEYKGKDMTVPELAKAVVGMYHEDKKLTGEIAHNAAVDIQKLVNGTSFDDDDSPRAIYGELLGMNKQSQVAKYEHSLVQIGKTAGAEAYRAALAPLVEQAVSESSSPAAVRTALDQHNRRVYLASHNMASVVPLSLNLTNKGEISDMEPNAIGNIVTENNKIVHTSVPARKQLQRFQKELAADAKLNTDDDIVNVLSKLSQVNKFYTIGQTVRVRKDYEGNEIRKVEEGFDAKDVKTLEKAHKVLFGDKDSDRNILLLPNGTKATAMDVTGIVKGMIGKGTEVGARDIIQVKKLGLYNKWKALKSQEVHKDGMNSDTKFKDMELFIDLDRLWQWAVKDKKNVADAKLEDIALPWVISGGYKNRKGVQVPFEVLKKDFAAGENATALQWIADKLAVMFRTPGGGQLTPWSRTGGDDTKLAPAKLRKTIKDELHLQLAAAMHWMTDGGGVQYWVGEEGAKLGKFMEKYLALWTAPYDHYATTNDLIIGLGEKYESMDAEDFMNKHAVYTKEDGTKYIRWAVADTDLTENELLQNIFGKDATDGTTFVFRKGNFELLQDALQSPRAGHIKTAYTSRENGFTTMHKSAIHYVDMDSMRKLAKTDPDLGVSVQLLDALARNLEAQGLFGVVFSSALKGNGAWNPSEAGGIVYNAQRQAIGVKKGDGTVDMNSEAVKALNDETQQIIFGLVDKKVPDYAILNMDLSGDNGISWISANKSSSRTRSHTLGMDMHPRAVFGEYADAVREPFRVYHENNIAKAVQYSNGYNTVAQVLNDYTRQFSTVEVEEPVEVIEPAPEEAVPGVRVFNDEQKAAIAEGVEFIKKGDPKVPFVITGKAGTGKTTIVQEIVKEWRKGGVVVSAVANKAKQLLSRKFDEAGIAHSAKSTAALLSATIDRNDAYVLNWDRPNPKMPLLEAKLIIIDEASMVNEEVLDYIMTFKADDAKVIFLGDVGQLSPIRDMSSMYYAPRPELENKKSRIFTDYSSSKLSKRVRSGENSPILKFADKFWDNSQKDNPEASPVPGTRTTEVNKWGAMIYKNTYADTLPMVESAFRYAIEANDVNHIKVVAYTNDRVNRINSEVRKMLFPAGTEEFAQNDWIILNSGHVSKGGGSFDNSLQGSIVGGEGSGTENVLGVDVTFYPRQILFDGSEAPSKETHKLITKDMHTKLWSAHKENTRRIRAEKHSQATENRLINESREKVGEFMYVNYAYAITSHKSQGSTYQITIADEKDIMSVKPTSAQTKSESIYTAVTRSQNVTIAITGNDIANDYTGDIRELNESIALTKYEPVPKEQSVESMERYTREYVKNNPDKVFLFGDNIEDAASGYVPTSTQAVIRGLPNAIGIPTKRNRGTNPDSYFNDTDIDRFSAYVNDALQKAKASGKTIVIPKDGIGTGKAMLAEKAPLLAEYLNSALASLPKEQTGTITRTEKLSRINRTYTDQQLEDAGTFLKRLADYVEGQEGASHTLVDADEGLSSLIRKAVAVDGKLIVERVPSLLVSSALFRGKEPLVNELVPKILEDVRNGIGIGSTLTFMPDTKALAEHKLMLRYLKSKHYQGLKRKWADGADARQLLVQQWNVLYPDMSFNDPNEIQNPEQFLGALSQTYNLRLDAISAELQKTEFNEYGLYADGGLGTTISIEEFEALNRELERDGMPPLTLGSKGMRDTTPKDDVDCLTPVLLTGLTTTPNTISSNKKQVLEVNGRDNDGDGGGFRVASSAWIDKDGTNQFDVLWDAFVKMGVHKGSQKSKDKQAQVFKAAKEATGKANVMLRTANDKSIRRVPVRSNPQDMESMKQTLNTNRNPGLIVDYINDIGQALMNLKHKFKRVSETRWEATIGDFKLVYDTELLGNLSIAKQYGAVDAHVMHELNIDDLIEGTFISSYKGKAWEDANEESENPDEITKKVIKQQFKKMVDLYSASVVEELFKPNTDTTVPARVAMTNKTLQETGTKASINAKLLNALPQLNFTSTFSRAMLYDVVDDIAIMEDAITENASGKVRAGHIHDAIKGTMKLVVSHPDAKVHNNGENYFMKLSPKWWGQFTGGGIEGAKRVSRQVAMGTLFRHAVLGSVERPIPGGEQSITRGVLLRSDNKGHYIDITRPDKSKHKFYVRDIFDKNGLMNPDVKKALDFVEFPGDPVHEGIIFHKNLLKYFEVPKLDLDTGSFLLGKVVGNIAKNIADLRADYDIDPNRLATQILTHKLEVGEYSHIEGSFLVYRNPAFAEHVSNPSMVVAGVKNSEVIPTTYTGRQLSAVIASGIESAGESDATESYSFSFGIFNTTVKQIAKEQERLSGGTVNPTPESILEAAHTIFKKKYGTDIPEEKLQDVLNFLGETIGTKYLNQSSKPMTIEEHQKMVAKAITQLVRSLDTAKEQIKREKKGGILNKVLSFIRATTPFKLNSKTALVDAFTPIEDKVPVKLDDPIAIIVEQSGDMVKVRDMVFGTTFDLKTAEPNVAMLLPVAEKKYVLPHNTAVDSLSRTSFGLQSDIEAARKNLDLNADFDALMYAVNNDELMDVPMTVRSKTDGVQRTQIIGDFAGSQVEINSEHLGDMLKNAAEGIPIGAVQHIESGELIKSTHRYGRNYDGTTVDLHKRRLFVTEVDPGKSMRNAILKENHYVQGEAFAVASWDARQTGESLELFDIEQKKWYRYTPSTETLEPTDTPDTSHFATDRYHITSKLEDHEILQFQVHHDTVAELLKEHGLDKSAAKATEETVEHLPGLTQQLPPSPALYDPEKGIDKTKGLHTALSHVMFGRMMMERTRLGVMEGIKHIEYFYKNSTSPELRQYALASIEEYTTVANSLREGSMRTITNDMSVIREDKQQEAYYVLDSFLKGAADNDQAWKGLAEAIYNDNAPIDSMEALSRANNVRTAMQHARRILAKGLRMTDEVDYFDTTKIPFKPSDRLITDADILVSLGRADLVSTDLSNMYEKYKGFIGHLHTTLDHLYQGEYLQNPTDNAIAHENVMKLLSTSDRRGVLYSNTDSPSEIKSKAIDFLRSGATHYNYHDPGTLLKLQVMNNQGQPRLVQGHSLGIYNRDVVDKDGNMLEEKVPTMILGDPEKKTFSYIALDNIQICKSAVHHAAREQSEMKKFMRLCSESKELKDVIKEVQRLTPLTRTPRGLSDYSDSINVSAEGIEVLRDIDAKRHTILGEIYKAGTAMQALGSYMMINHIGTIVVGSALAVGHFTGTVEMFNTMMLGLGGLALKASMPLLDNFTSSHAGVTMQSEYHVLNKQFWMERFDRTTGVMALFEPKRKLSSADATIPVASVDKRFAGEGGGGVLTNELASTDAGDTLNGITGGKYGIGTSMATYFRGLKLSRQMHSIKKHVEPQIEHLKTTGIIDLMPMVTEKMGTYMEKKGIKVHYADGEVVVTAQGKPLDEVDNMRTTALGAIASTLGMGLLAWSEVRSAKNTSMVNTYYARENSDWDNQLPEIKAMYVDTLNKLAIGDYAGRSVTQLSGLGRVMTMYSLFSKGKYIFKMGGLWELTQEKAILESIYGKQSTNNPVLFGTKTHNAGRIIRSQFVNATLGAMVISGFNSQGFNGIATKTVQAMFPGYAPATFATELALGLVESFTENKYTTFEKEVRDEGKLAERVNSVAYAVPMGAGQNALIFDLTFGLQYMKDLVDNGNIGNLEKISQARLATQAATKTAVLNPMTALTTPALKGLQTYVKENP